MKILNVKTRVNKSNGQVNISLPKKQLPKDFFKNIPANMKIKIMGIK